MIHRLHRSVDLAAIREEWISIGLTTGPDDVELRDRSIDLAYRAAGLDPPRVRILLRSPLEGTIGAHLLSQGEVEARDQVEGDVAARVRDQVGAQARDLVGAQARDQVVVQVRDQVGAQLATEVVFGVRAQVEAQVWAQVRHRVGAQVRDQVEVRVRDQVGAQAREQTGRAGYGSHDAHWPASYEAFRVQFGACIAPAEGLWGLTRSTGWWWPFRGAVILTPRPSELHMASGRLHRDGGPALAYPDGFALWRLNGVAVPDWLAATPADAIDPRRLPAIPNASVRREFIRKVGIGRILAALGARVISWSGPYELLELDLGDGRRRPYLKVQNPSVDAVHIEGVHPRCRTVQEALNYRNGLAPEAIDDAAGADWYQQGDVILRPRGAKRFKSRPKILT
jgi:hypothetical protein